MRFVLPIPHADMCSTPLYCLQLDLSRNAVGPEGAKAIADALRVNAPLTLLNLGGNKVGDDGATAIAQAVKSNTTCKLAELGLNNNGIGTAGAEALADMLSVSASLTTVNTRSRLHEFT